MLEMAELNRALVGLGGVLLLIVLAAWLVRRLAPALTSLPRGRERRLVLVETLPLDPRTRLVLVRMDGRDHLLAVGAGGTVMLSAQPASVAARSAPSPETAS